MRGIAACSASAACSGTRKLPSAATIPRRALGSDVSATARMSAPRARSDFRLASASAMATRAAQNGSARSSSLQRFQTLPISRFPQCLGGLNTPQNVRVVSKLEA